jgi:3-deoxy-D-manno-octulosonate 8-phosphate phosphatase (KDO 8-P phosphatase)
MPVAAVISGEINPSARQFVLREHFDCLYAGVKNKRAAVDHLCSQFGLEPAAVACVYDDVNDLAMADTCGLRVMIRRPSSPLFAAFARSHALCDYISGSRADRCAVREVSELLLGLLGLFEQVVGSRTAFDSSYREYFDGRQGISSRFYGQADDEIVEISRVNEKSS